MHTYASQTAEARELVAELEFVWDQVKSNLSSSAGSISSPVLSTGVPPLPQSAGSYGSIGAQLAPPEYQHLVSTARGDSRLRVLSPVSQPDGVYQRRAARMDYEREQEDIDGGNLDEDEEEEEYAEAQATLYEDDDIDNDHDEVGVDVNVNDHHEYTNHIPDSTGSRSRSRKHTQNGNDYPNLNLNLNHNPEPEPNSFDPNPDPFHNAPSQETTLMQKKDDTRWRRRVEQALTKMTAEIAAAREQMEARAIAHRRRSGVWAWLRWLVWVTLRQIIWDLAVLGMLLIWMRVRRDRRLEEQIRVGWKVVKGRLLGLRALRAGGRTAGSGGTGVYPIFP